jgi:Leucine-rich repeat (LRR) protein
VLIASNNNIEELGALRKMASLRYLDLSLNSLADLTRAFDALSRLHVLKLNGNEVTQEVLEGAPKLVLSQG